jgi:O-antigen/teichoic acid export membrane protein
MLKLSNKKSNTFLVNVLYKGLNMNITKSLLLMVLLVSPVFAYIDPGSGSAIMSAIIGFFVAIGIAIKTYWYKLKSMFSSKSKDDK